MESFNFEVIYRYRWFKNLVLNLFKDNVIAVDSNKNISGSKVDSTYPSFFGYIEGMSRCSDNGFLRSRKVNELVCFVYKCLNDLLEFGFSCFRICCPNPIACFYCFNGNMSNCGCNQSSRNKANNSVFKALIFRAWTDKNRFRSRALQMSSARFISA